MCDKATVLQQLVALCNELELFPGDATQWILSDLADGTVFDSISRVQLSALVAKEFGVAISSEAFLASTRTLDEIAEQIVNAISERL